MIVIDMDMPKSCEKCKFFDGEDMCYVDGTYALNPSRISVRPSWCPIKCDIEDIKAEIQAIKINGQVDEHIMFTRSGEQVKNLALEIIDKHISGDMRGAE